MENQSAASIDQLREKLDWDEIKRRYPDEWVAMVDYDKENHHVVAGVVVSHSSDQREALAMAGSPPKMAFLWTGKIRSLSFWALMNARRPI